MTDREALGFLRSILDGIDDKESMVMVLNHEKMKGAIRCAAHALEVQTSDSKCWGCRCPRMRD